MTSPDSTHQEAQQLLRMAVGTEVLAVPITEVREILQFSRLTPIPRTPPFVRGVMNLRGAVVPVLDLAARLGQAPTPPGRRNCVVVVDRASRPAQDGEEPARHEGPNGRMIMGLLVDCVYEVFDNPAGATEAVPALGTRVPAEFLAGMTRAHGQIVGVLDFERLLATPELATLIAEHSKKVVH